MTETALTPVASTQEVDPQAIYDMPVPSEAAVAHYGEMVTAARQLLKPGIHLEKVPGIKEPVFKQSAARVLCAAWALRPKFEVLPSSVENSATGEYHYKISCYLLRGPHIVGEGIGSATTKEKKYAYRWLLAKDISQDPELSHLNIEALPKRFNKWKRTDEYRIPNPEIHDLVNTVLKMAKKRAYVDATLNTFGLDGEFTQDLEDSPGARRQAQQNQARRQEEPPPPREEAPAQPVAATDVWAKFAAFCEEVKTGTKGVQEGLDKVRVLCFELFDVKTLADIEGANVSEFRKWLNESAVPYLETEGYIKRAGS